jgi:hypothetical protein
VNGQPEYPDDTRSDDAVRFDAFVDEVRDSAAEVRALVVALQEWKSHDHGTTQTVIHKTEGISGVVGAAIALGFCSMLMLLGMLVWIVPIVHDLQAWEQVHQARILAIENKGK